MTPVIPTSVLSQECPTCKEACGVWPFLQCPLFLSPSPTPILPASPSLSGPKSHGCYSSYKQKHNGDFPAADHCYTWDPAQVVFACQSVSILAMGSTSPTKVLWSGTREMQEQEPRDRNQGTGARQASWQAQRQPLCSG